MNWSLSLNWSSDKSILLLSTSFIFLQLFPPSFLIITKATVAKWNMYTCGWKRVGT
jgi:hypothetical protein